MASTESHKLGVISVNAGVDLRTKMFYAVKLSADRAVILGTAGAAIGILQNDPNLNETAAVMVGSGISQAILGAAVVAGAPVTSDGAGKIITAVALDTIIGFCLEGGILNEYGTIIMTLGKF